MRIGRRWEETKMVGGDEDRKTVGGDEDGGRR